MSEERQSAIWLDGRCPACKVERVVFVEDGHATCSYVGCPDPSLADHQSRVLGTGIAADALGGRCSTCDGAGIIDTSHDGSWCDSEDCPDCATHQPETEL